MGVTATLNCWKTSQTLTLTLCTHLMVVTTHVSRVPSVCGPHFEQQSHGLHDNKRITPEKKLPHFLTSGKEKPFKKLYSVKAKIYLDIKHDDEYKKVMFSKSKDALRDKGGVAGTLEKTELLSSQRSAFPAANSIHSGQCYQCKIKWAKKARRVCQLFL